MIEPSTAEVVTQIATTASKTDLSTYLMAGGGTAVGLLAFWRVLVRYIHVSALDKSGVQVRKDLDQSLIETIKDLRYQVVEERKLASRERDRADAAAILAQEAAKREGELQGQLSALSAQVEDLKKEVRQLLESQGAAS